MWTEERTNEKNGTAYLLYFSSRLFVDDISSFQHIISSALSFSFNKSRRSFFFILLLLFTGLNKFYNRPPMSKNSITCFTLIIHRNWNGRRWNGGVWWCWDISRSCSVGRWETGKLSKCFGNSSLTFEVPCSFKIYIRCRWSKEWVKKKRPTERTNKWMSEKECEGAKKIFHLKITTGALLYIVLRMYHELACIDRLLLRPRITW